MLIRQRFIAGSVACALAPTMWMLIVGRALQGIGGGGILRWRRPSSPT